MSRSALLEDVIVLAQAAGDAIMQVYAKAFVSADKDDGSPLTEADLAAHHIIVEGLERLTPTTPIISEESPVPELAERQQWAQHWLVDPLDGTREFIKRNGEFTVNITLIENGQPVLGVVVAPALNQTYAAILGSPAFKIENGVRSFINARKLPAVPAYYVSRSHRNAEMDAFLNRVPAHEEITMGSSLKFCRIGEGEADCYPRFGPINEWDTAAAHCVLVAAGGAVLSLPSFTPMPYNAKPTLALPDFFAVGDASADWAGINAGHASQA